MNNKIIVEVDNYVYSRTRQFFMSVILYIDGSAKIIFVNHREMRISLKEYIKINEFLDNFFENQAYLEKIFYSHFIKNDTKKQKEVIKNGK